MKTILVTSAVTFVPNNYRGLWERVLQQPSVEALIVLDNRSLDLQLKAALLIASLAAPQMGLQLLKNLSSASLEEKKSVCKKLGKKFFLIQKLSSNEGLEILRALSPDLLINARTREIFSNEVLKLPRLGCWNIHHGLLPDQRGLMCDFWSHLHDLDCGFSIHEMTEKLDAGRIIHAQPIARNPNSYLSYTETAAKQEGELICNELDLVLQGKQINYKENLRTAKTLYRRNPKLRDFYNLNFKKGIRI